MSYASTLRADCFSGDTHVVTGGGSCVRELLANEGAA